MRHVDYRTLIDRGRKAGLGTAELYTALAARRPEVSEHSAGMADGNGFVWDYNRHGQAVFRPASKPTRA